MVPSVFAETWSDTERKLARALRGLRVDPDTVEEVVQETALRAFADVARFDDARHLTAWSRKTAINLAIDVGRRRVREGGQFPDVVVESVEAEVLAAVTLADVVKAFTRLSPLEREAIVSAINGRSGSTVRVRVRRCRARARLAVLAKIATVVGVLSRTIRRGHRVAFAAAAAVSLIVLMPWATPDSPPASPVRLNVPLPGAARPPTATAAVAAGTATGRATPPRPTPTPPMSTTTRRPPRPHVNVAYPGPFGTAGVDARPGRGDEPILCVNLGSPKCAVEIDDPALPVIGPASAAR